VPQITSRITLRNNSLRRSIHQKKKTLRLLDAPGKLRYEESALAYPGQVFFSVTLGWIGRSGGCPKTRKTLLTVGDDDVNCATRIESDDTPDALAQASLLCAACDDRR
jgi:hypothetical protein